MLFRLFLSLAQRKCDGARALVAVPKLSTKTAAKVDLEKKNKGKKSKGKNKKYFEDKNWSRGPKGKRLSLGELSLGKA